MTAQHRILLVDDDPSILRLAQFCLEARGLTVILAEDGDRALDLLRDEDFDLVVLDLMLPGKNGFEVLAILRSSQRNAEVPVYILSARASDGFASKQRRPARTATSVSHSTPKD